MSHLGLECVILMLSKRTINANLQKITSYVEFYEVFCIYFGVEFHLVSSLHSSSVNDQWS